MTYRPGRRPLELLPLSASALARDSGDGAPESVPNSSPTLQGTLAWQPQTLDWLWCFSHRRFNFYAQPYAAQPGEVEVSKSRTGRCIDRQRLQLECLTRSY
jgi:hypothetical protein